MRGVVSIALIALLSFQAFVKLGMVTWYETNKEVITELFCINKDKPILQCNGKCHLAKQIEKIEEPTTEESGQTPPTLVERLEVPVYLTSDLIVDWCDHLAVQQHFSILPCDGKPNRYQTDVFRPPCAA